MSSLIACLFLLISGFIDLHAPVSQSDSLQIQLDTTTIPQQKASVLLTLARTQQESNPQLAIQHYEEVLLLAQEMGDNNLIVSTYNEIGAAWYFDGDLQNSMKYYFMALDGLKDIESNYSQFCKIYNNIAWNFQKQKDFIRALDYYNMSEEYCRRSSQSAYVAHILNNKGVVYKDLKQYDKALSLLQQSLEINRQNEDIKKELFNINNIGVIYLELGNYKEADQYFLEALRSNMERNDHYEATHNMTNLGQSYYLQGRYKEAEDTLKHALKLSEVNRSTDQKHEALDYLYQVKREQKDYKEALTYYTQYHALEDSLYKHGQYTDLIELEAKYKVAQKERVIQESNNQLLRQRYLNTMFLSALIFALLLIGVLIWIYSTKKRNERKLILLNKEIDAQNEKIQSINHNLEQTINKRTKQIQEQNNQLREFAFMNSHNIRRPLSNVLGLLALLEDENDPEKIKELVFLANQTASEMDQIIQDVNIQLKEGEL
ncbi:tetratricopeptide repeat protein [Reichenbachiella sp. MSK19-1]|uniref:tetratricopeptide repeat protein n=1 Tax=Reichenbachiella sp. MSK19-1 TaxID=1897631 RepID=UPI000E6D29C2|nr:tetratricopeptide repeat protein [Reichenbachiella sp. MSK19-1]RJE74182.1 hypothetical protein BGP76_13405 [Reichenbachiella sp. MSK19-1]